MHAYTQQKEPMAQKQVHACIHTTHAYTGACKNRSMHTHSKRNIAEVNILSCALAVVVVAVVPFISGWDETGMTTEWSTKQKEVAPPHLGTSSEKAQVWSAELGHASWDHHHISTCAKQKGEEEETTRYKHGRRRWWYLHHQISGCPTTLPNW